MAKKKDGRGKRYTAAQKAYILKVAAAKKLTAAQVQKHFGVSAITFYRWRGPVRGKRAGRGSVATPRAADLAALRGQVQAGVQRILPSVIRQEVRASLERVLAAGRRAGRRRGRKPGPKPRKAK